MHFKWGWWNIYSEDYFCCLLYQKVLPDLNFSISHLSGERGAKPGSGDSGVGELLMKSCFSSSIVESISMILTQHSGDAGNYSVECRFVKNSVGETSQWI